MLRLRRHRPPRPGGTRSISPWLPERPDHPPVKHCIRPAPARWARCSLSPHRRQLSRPRRRNKSSTRRTAVLSLCLAGPSTARPAQDCSRSPPRYRGAQCTTPTSQPACAGLWPGACRADAASENVRAAVWIVLLTGCGRSEMCQIRADDIGEDSILIQAGNTKTCRQTSSVTCWAKPASRRRRHYAHAIVGRQRSALEKLGALTEVKTA
jgi:hypothetical protein